MKLKILVLGILSTVALALAGPALAIQTLTVTPSEYVVGGSGNFTIGIAQDAADAPIAKVTIYAPVGYSSLFGQSVGAKIGTASGVVILKALAGARAPVTGDINVADPAAFRTDARNLGCTGQANHDAVWILNLSLAGNALPIPVFVDRVTTGAETGFAGIKLQVCFSSPDVPQASGGAPNGAQPIEAAMTLTDVIANPQTAGTYTWRTLFTPYTPGTANANPAGTVEARSLVQLPTQLTMTGKRTKKFTGKGKKRKALTYVTLRGSLTQVNVGVPGASVVIKANGKAVKTVRTTGTGAYAVTLRVTKKTTFSADTSIAVKRDDAGGCAGAAVFPGVRCVTATVAAAAVKGRSPFTVVPYKK
jgi:hypothetical protein